MKKIVLKLHLWLSIPFGIVISILCLTGGLLVFETEILQIVTPSRYYVKEVKEHAIPLEQLIPIIQQQLPDTVSISSVTFPAEANRYYRMGMTGMGRLSLLVDPYTGEVINTVSPYSNDKFFPVVRRLHRFFMYPMQRDSDKTNWGKMLTGTATLIFVFILISGIIIWIPKTVTMLKRRLTIKTGAGKFRFWYDVHLAGGMYMAIFLLMIALTGLTWSFKWYRTGFYKVFGVETTQGGGHTPPVQQANQVQVSSGRPSGEKAEGDEDTEGEEKSGRGRQAGERDERAGRTERAGQNGDGERRSGEGGQRRGGGEHGGRGRRGPDYGIWVRVYNQLAASNPNYKTIAVQNGSATVSAPVFGNVRASDKYMFDNRTGEITDVQLYKDNPKASKIRGWIYSFHVGSWGGIFTRILYFIACLIGTALPITGYYIYIKKNWKKKRKT
ncbi:MAG: PepSY domain-containing protein [Tannerellaceae bacterium]|nr:PepSY domain-containing protein [Tannerellaceae bacterium]